MRLWTCWITAIALTATTAFADTPKDGVDTAGEKPAAKTVTVGKKVGQRLPHFATTVWDLTAEKATSAKHDSHALTRPTAYVFMTKTCPYCVKYQDRLSTMAAHYRKRGLDFVMVYPTRSVPLEQKIAYHKTAKLGSAFVNDTNAAIARALGISKTPEVVLVDAKGLIIFRGGIDDNPHDAKAIKSHYLRNACDQLLAGKPVSVMTAPLFG